VIDEVDMDSGLATPEVCVYIYVTGCMQVCVVYVYLNAEGRCQIKEFDRFKVARGRKDTVHVLGMISSFPHVRVNTLYGKLQLQD
jgi:hypothetical protein